jgi:hypothetical protein
MLPRELKTPKTIDFPDNVARRYKIAHHFQSASLTRTMSLAAKHSINRKHTTGPGGVTSRVTYWYLQCVSIYSKDAEKFAQYYEPLCQPFWPFSLVPSRSCKSRLFPAKAKSGQSANDKMPTANNLNLFILPRMVSVIFSVS